MRIYNIVLGLLFIWACLIVFDHGGLEKWLICPLLLSQGVLSVGIVLSRSFRQGAMEAQNRGYEQINQQ